MARSVVQVTQVAAGRYHNVALTSLGLVYTWGFASDQLGLSTAQLEAAVNTPQLVEPLLPENGGGRITSVTVSSNKTCVVSEAGDLYTWGVADDAVSLLRVL